MGLINRLHVISGFFKLILIFIRWIFIEIIYQFLIEQAIYRAGKFTIKMLSAGWCQVDKPSNFMKFIINFTGVIVILAFLYLISHLPQLFS